MITFDIITIFPNAFGYLEHSIPKIAQEKEKVKINIHDLRDFGIGKWKQVDDKPFGGGAGMLMMVEPLYKAIKKIQSEFSPEEKEKSIVLMTSARGEEWTQDNVEYYKNEYTRVVIICGHYEGVDQRIIDNLVDKEISVGKFILSGGELASMIIVDSIVRLIDGVVGNELSIESETSFSKDFKEVEYPHYTRPAEFKTEDGKIWKVPSILTSGNHSEIEKWKKENTKKIDY